MQERFFKQFKNLRLLFFLSSGEYWQYGLEMDDAAFLLKAKLKDDNNFPKLCTAYHVSWHAFYNRREDSLSCQDSQYIATYEKIATHLEDLHCTTWFVVPNNS